MNVIVDIFLNIADELNEKYKEKKETRKLLSSFNMKGLKYQSLKLLTHRYRHRPYLVDLGLAFGYSSQDHTCYLHI